jgi:hypothetical protein
MSRVGQLRWLPRRPRISGPILQPAILGPPRDVTRFTYYSTGDVASINDALGHITPFTSYDADGRPLSSMAGVRK